MPVIPGRPLDQRMLLELRLAACIGATLYVPCHALLAILDFGYASRPWEGLFVRALSAAVIWLLVWLLHARIRDPRHVGLVDLSVYAAVMAPVFWIARDLPGTFLVGFLPSLVALAIFLPGRPAHHWAIGGVCVAAALLFVWNHREAHASVPRPYVLAVIANIGLISAGGSYLAARRREEAVRWHEQAVRLEELLAFGEQLSRVGLVPAEQVAELAVRAAAPGGGGREALVRDLLAAGRITPFQADRLLGEGAASLVTGSYVLLDLLGSGGMGEVHRARHEGTGVEVALKRLHQKGTPPQIFSRFRRETELAATLEHPHIVRTVETFEEQGTPVLVMEYVSGGCAEDLVAEGRRPPAAAVVDIGCQIAEALDHAWQRGIVHRDVKPANILLGKDGSAKLADFGIAQVRQASEATAITRTGFVIGTLDYMAPEQARDPREADLRSDLYSLGCTLYHLLSGCVPFEGTTVLEKLEAHQRRTPTPLTALAPGVPPSVAAVVERMMAKDPDARFPSGAAVVCALRDSIEASAAGGPAPLSRTRQRDS